MDANRQDYDVTAEFARSLLVNRLPSGPEDSLPTCVQTPCVKIGQHPPRFGFRPLSPSEAFVWQELAERLDLRVTPASIPPAPRCD
jgi:hypothetical protein